MSINRQGRRYPLIIRDKDEAGGSSPPGPTVFIPEPTSALRAEQTPVGPPPQAGPLPRRGRCGFEF
ncbi:MAG: hypothetical protein Q8Q52_03010, partial [Acidimicrobiia bacterium]|nr:hypothetical protein [Acidimicrobiia bacterium]